jgi:hypothetical protein
MIYINSKAPGYLQQSENGYASPLVIDIGKVDEDVAR